MNVALWCAQILLAVVFTTSGIMKSTLPKDDLVAKGQTGVQFFPTPAIRLIAASELLGVLGLILPRLTGIAEVLTPVAAIGLAIVMLGAMVTHIMLREPKNIAITITILGVCIFVAVGRFIG
jgi:uncharacterized membrane protein YphA (DoxX/SURF4 family)